MHRIAPRIVVSLAVLCLAAAAAPAAVIEKQFPAAPGGKLQLDTDFGSVTVRSASIGEVQIRVELDSRAEDRLEVKFEVGGGGVTIIGEDRKSRLMSWGRSGKAHFEITVPAVYDLDLDTAGGSIAVGAIQGEVRVDTSGGPITLDEIDGPVWADTSGGSIELTSSRGDAKLSTSGGYIRIGQVDGRVDAETSGGSIDIDRAAGEVRAHTSGGNIEVREVGGTIDASTSGGSVRATLTDQPRGDCRLETSGGRVTLRLAQSIALDLDASASGGGVRVDVPVEIEGRHDRNRLEGTINGGGPLMRLRSSGGGVSVEPL